MLSPLSRVLCYIINDYLEEMAKTIYDYWFIQFDFPGENGKPYKSSGGKMSFCNELNREIPQNWNYTSIGNITICSIVNYLYHEEIRGSGNTGKRNVIQ